jgi:hypothetical protein
MREQNVDVGFVCCNPQAEVCGLPSAVVDFLDRKSNTLADCVRRQDPNWLWVQLSGYGYSRWGAPWALTRSLAALRRAFPAIRIAVCAHELFCRPNQLGRKGLLLSPWQRSTNGKIVGMADVVFASTQQYREEMVRDLGIAREKSVLLPIGANVPAIHLKSQERAKLRSSFGWGAQEVIAVVFGSAALQARTLERFEHILTQGFKSGRLHRLVGVGGQPGVIPSECRDWARRLSAHGQVELLGHQPGQRIGEILACADLGLCLYPRHLLQKSTVFVAFAFAGLPVLSFHDPREPVLAQETLPFLRAEDWNWEHASGAQILAMAVELKFHAESHWNWDAIARRALDRMGARHPAPAQGR